MNSFGSRSVLRVGSKEYEIYRLNALDENGISTKHLPYSLRILLENLLRTEDGRNVTENDIRALAAWNSKSKPDKEIAFTPSRVLLQDFTGVPAVVDLAAMRDAMKRLSRRSQLDQSRCSRRSWSSITRCRWTNSARRNPFNSMPSWNSFATRNAMPSCAGAKPLSAIWPSSRPIPASFTR